MKLPILLLTFNRPSETSILIKKLSLVKPSKIYISQDGPRKSNINDKVNCEK